MKRFVLALPLAVLMLSAQLVNADVLISFGSATIDPGDQVLIGVFVSGDEELTGYTLPIEVGNGQGENGRGFPPGISFAPGDFVIEDQTFSDVIIGGLDDIGGGVNQNYEALLSDVSLAGEIVLSNTPIKLFDIVFDTTLDFNAATVNLTDGGDLPFLSVTTNTNTYTTLGGGLTTTSGLINIPEPTVVPVVAMAVAGMVMRRRRR